MIPRTTISRSSFLLELTPVALLAPSLTTAVRNTTLAHRIFDGVREQISTAIAQGRATGVAVAVSQGGNMLWEEGFGWADRERGVRVTSRTPFCLASVTKPFTASAIMTLIQSGHLALDKTILDSIGSEALRGFNDDARQVTLRVLGAHVSGLPSLFEMYPLSGASRPPTTHELLERYGRLAYKPRETYEYSNIGYSILGDVAERATGLAFREFLRQQLLVPLGLTDSFFGADVAQFSALPYDELNRPIPRYATATPPSGELYASARDVMRFAIFNLGHKIGAQSPLSRTSLNVMHEPVFGGPDSGWTTFGWFLGRTTSGIRVIFKSGGQPGVSTALYLIPDANLACVILTNRSDPEGWAQNTASSIIRSVIPHWAQPDTSVGARLIPLASASGFGGDWSGSAAGDGVEVIMRLEINGAQSAAMKIGSSANQPISAMSLEAGAFLGSIKGHVSSPDSVRNETDELALKLERRSGRLVGRLLASSARPGWLALVPYIVSLGKVV